MIRETFQRVKPPMASPTPKFIRRFGPAASFTLLLFSIIFMVACLAHKLQANPAIELRPYWVKALIGAGIFSLPVGLIVAFFSCYAEGKERRIREMLDRK
jgi:hypothetical protein